MKISILQQDLLPALSTCARSIGVRSTLPVLANVLIQTEDSKLKLSATNLEIGVIKLVNANVLESGEITVPAKTLVDIISPLSNQEIEIETSGELLKITTKNFNATLNGIAASEFPAIPLASSKSVVLSSKILAQSLPEITFAAAVDEGRPVLTGILTEIKKDTLELVATDGFRLSHKTVKLGYDEQQPFKSLIPRRTFEEVVRIIQEELGSGDDENVEISTTENQNQMIFKIGGCRLSSRLIEGTFPAWEKIVPQKFLNRTIIEKVDLLKAVKVSSVFAKDNANIVKIEMVKKDGTVNKLKLTSEAKELGGQETEIDVASCEGEDITIAFNSKYLLDALSACPGAQVSIEFSGNLSPALIKPVGEVNLEYVVMPIRLS